MQVERVDFVAIPSRDSERARAFYRDVLELPQDEHAKYEFTASNATLAIYEPEKVGAEFIPSSGDIALRVADVAASRAELEAKGVAFKGETLDTGVCHMAFFTDPDGNNLMLHRRYKPYE